ncbi:uncharacterized protein LOC122374650 [Amphibalanus amphitrite]|uniref:uncharacterized protein LOC122374650 n=1 Tax=Amphibalanus amphitrite TaxID=1232801 RepID=UPI001C908CBC|nr:uncharacterized protein LOC122374650 [Amphibalanus amphitrite]
MRKKKSAKEYDWRIVAEECRSEVDLVKEKWRHVRDYYIARRRKQPPSGSSASAGRQLGRYGQILSFLDPVAQRGPTTSSADFRRPNSVGPSHPAPAPVPAESDLLLDDDGSIPVGSYEEVDENETQFSAVPMEPGTGGAQTQDSTPDTINDASPAPHTNPTPSTNTTATNPAPITNAAQNINATPSTSHYRNHAQDQQTTPQQSSQTTRTPKRKLGPSPDVDRAIMAELQRGRERQMERERERDADSEYHFCMYLYAELRKRNGAARKEIKRRFCAVLDDYDSE